MVNRAEVSLPELHVEDEAAWLGRMARLATERRVEAIDFENLGASLTGMARRDRREVFGRMVVLPSHLLKWEFQPEKRSATWRGTIVAQRRELRLLLLEGGTRRNRALASLADADRDARDQASAETGPPPATFPEQCGWSVDELIARGPEVEPS